MFLAKATFMTYDTRCSLFSGEGFTVDDAASLQNVIWCVKDIHLGPQREQRESTSESGSSSSFWLLEVWFAININRVQR